MLVDCLSPEFSAYAKTCLSKPVSMASKGLLSCDISLLSKACRNPQISKLLKESWINQFPTIIYKQQILYVKNHFSQRLSLLEFFYRIRSEKRSVALNTRLARGDPKCIEWMKEQIAAKYSPSQRRSKENKSKEHSGQVWDFTDPNQPNRKLQKQCGCIISTTRKRERKRVWYSESA